MKLKIWTAAICIAAVGFLKAQNPLLIPDTLAGPNVQLTVGAGTRNYFPGFTTNTWGYNGAILGPTLLLQTGDSVTLNVTNTLNTGTTVHWHGFHVAPEHDGGPHQVIPPGGTWSPSFRMRNRASTLWYHPHGEGRTEYQVTRGLAGFVIVRDAAEAAYAIPRHYGVDDFPLVLQSKAIDIGGQFAIATHEDSIMLVNATLDPYLDAPQQVIRLRLLNGSTDRSYYLGLSDQSAFHLIASDGGLLAAPLPVTRVRLSPGERAEILVNLGSYAVGSQVDLMSFASELPRGILGADSVGTASILIGEGYYANPLNGADFRILRLQVTAPTANPILSVPATFAPLQPLDTLGVQAHRLLHLGADTVGFGEAALVNGPFKINGAAYNMDTINIRIPLNNKEIWTLTNTTEVAHPFHIHDVQFFVVDINRLPPPPQYAGLKDVILVMPHDTVRFVTVFDDFANDSIPYMYHCHLLHHEDEGMMGQFVVLSPPTAAASPTEEVHALHISPNPATENIMLTWEGVQEAGNVEIWDAFGRRMMAMRVPANGKISVAGWAPGMYIAKVNVGSKQASRTFLKL